MGAPIGNQNARKRHFSQAVESVLMMDDERTKRKRLYNIAHKLVEKAEEGDMSAIKEVADRTDGKSAQSVTLSGDEENPLFFSEIKRSIVDPRD